MAEKAKNNSELDSNKVIISTHDGQSINLPLHNGSVGPSVVDIRKFYSQTGMFTFDPASPERR